MRVLRTFVAVLLLPVLAVVVVGFILGTSVNETVLHADFLKTEFIKTNAYEVLVNELQRQLVRSTAIPGQSTAAGQDEFSSIVSQVLEPAWLQTEVERNLDGLEAWLNNDGQLALALDLTSRRAALTAILQQQLPDRIATDAGQALPEQIDLLNLNQSLGPFLDSIGSPPISGAEELRANFESFKQTVQEFRRWLTVAFVVLVGLGVFELLLMAGQRKKQVRWLSTMLWVSGLLSLAVGAIGLLGANALVVGQLTLGGLSPATQSAIAGLARNIVAAVSYPLLAVGAALILGSLVVRFLSVFVRRPSTPASTPNQRHR
ncbi:MAG: hypothetical protein HY421_03025 [Candidatus Kerfeldbacteria bacterium]|nr:hypothetical protein [Candidatus Kerfeldbacteria bacterium]